MQSGSCSYSISSPWPAPGKLNLVLKVVGQRADGYHLLQTVFQLIDRSDRLWFEPRADGRIVLQTPLAGVAEHEDLTVRAARLLQEESGCRSGVSISVEKRLPVGGGLGGGSSDAATTLLVLDRLWGVNVGPERLRRLGLRLGADVPVFLEGSSAWAEGIGERLTPIDLPESWYVVVVPGCHVSTKAVFSSPYLTKDNERITMEQFRFVRQENDCADVVVEMYPLVGMALKELSRYGKAKLTGTGACVFLSFEEKADAHRAAQALSRRWEVFVCKGVNRSPLHKRLAQDMFIEGKP